MNFLQEETFPSSKELLVMHFLQKGRYVEGIRLNELMKKSKLVCIQPSYLICVIQFQFHSDSVRH